MKNRLNREVDRYSPFLGASETISKSNTSQVPVVLSTNQNKNKVIESISELFNVLEIKDGMTFSFHHHLRNGDYVVDLVSKEVERLFLKNLTFAPSSIFPTHKKLVDLIKNQNVTKIYTNYMNGPVSECIAQGYLKEHLIMQTHGGRPRSIESGELVIDVAFIAVPTSDSFGNGNGRDGKSACGALGYTISDMMYAKKKVVITDHLVESVDYAEILGEYIDYVLVVDAIGDPKGIVSGTTKVTRDPVGLKIAKNAAKLLDEIGMIHNGFSFQTGAGGTSLAVAQEVRKIMIDKNVRGSFLSGGTTAFLVEMLEAGLFEEIKDVQCFDLEAVRSYRENANHIPMSSSKYGNPYHPNVVVNQLDVVILGATEIDLDFNVNVTTDSNGLIIGGSGGHSDTAFGAKVTVIVTQMMKSRTAIIKERVTTITTPGETIDVLVTERGIAINPRRTDLLEKLKSTRLNIVPIEQLYELTKYYCGEPSIIPSSNEVIGVVEYRDGTAIDLLYKVN